MKLLVTGGAGFIGSNFIHYWISSHSNDSIINLDKLTYAGNLENLQRILNNQNYAFIKGDITDVKLVDSIVKDVEVIVHFAAESHVDRSISGPDVFIMTNVIGTQVLLDAAIKNKIKRFHHVSTDEVFGSLELNTNDKFSEKTSYGPRSPYAASKASSDHLVRAYGITYGLPITITNCSNNYGPYHHPEKLIPLAITNLIEHKKVPVYGDGLNVRDWLYVEDHCKAIDRVLSDGKLGETYCVGGLTDGISNVDVVKKIISLMGEDDSMIEYISDRPGHDRRYALDWTKIKNDLSWNPEHDFDTWLDKTVNWYKNNENWWKRVKSGEYQNYYKNQYE